MRLRSSIRHSLELLAERAHRSVSEIAQELIEEGIRMRECPGIYFASEPAGRTAKIAGTGLAVWELLRDFVHDHDAQRLRQAFPRVSRPAHRRGDVLRAIPEEIRARSRRTRR